MPHAVEDHGYDMDSTGFVQLRQSLQSGNASVSLKGQGTPSQALQLDTADKVFDTADKVEVLLLVVSVVALTLFFQYVLGNSVQWLKASYGHVHALLTRTCRDFLSCDSKGPFEAKNAKNLSAKRSAEPAVIIDAIPPETTLLGALAGDADAMAIASTSGISWSYAELRGVLTSRSWAAFAKYMRVALILPPGDELAIALLSLMARTSVAPLDPNLSTEELTSALRQLRVEAVLHGPSTAEVAIAAKDLGLPIFELPMPMCKLPLQSNADDGLVDTHTHSWMRADDVTLLLRTSGTTGKSKVVPLRLGQLLHGAKCIASSMALSSSDICLNVMPLFHIGGISCNLLAPLVSGGAVVCLEAFQPDTFLKALSTRQKMQPTWYYASPSIHLSLAEFSKSQGQEHCRAHNLRLVRSGAAVLSPELQERLEALFQCTVFATYSMSECMPIASPITCLPSKHVGLRSQPLGSVGRPIGPCVVVHAGEVMLQGPLVMKSYEAAASSGWTSDGLFPTGDLGELDGDGFLWLQGRSKEIINRGGETLAPQEIENLAQRSPNVKEVAAYAVPHALLGEAVGLAVVLEVGVKASSCIAENISKKLSSKLRPSVITFVDTLPRTATGKVQRLALQQKLQLTTGSPVELSGEERSLMVLEARGNVSHKPSVCSFISPEPGTVAALFLMDGEGEGEQELDSLGIASTFSARKSFDLQTVSYMNVIGVVGINFVHWLWYSPQVHSLNPDVEKLMMAWGYSSWHLSAIFVGAGYFDACHNPDLNARDFFMYSMVVVIPLIFKPLEAWGFTGWTIQHPARWFFFYMVLGRIYVVLGLRLGINKTVQAVLALPASKWACKVMLQIGHSSGPWRAHLIGPPQRSSQHKFTISMFLYILSFLGAPRLVELAARHGPRSIKTQRLLGAICWLCLIITTICRGPESRFDIHEADSEKPELVLQAILVILTSISFLAMATAWMPPTIIPQLACKSLLGSILLLPIFGVPCGKMLEVIPKIPILGESALGQAVALIAYMGVLTCILAYVCNTVFLACITGLSRVLSTTRKALA